MYDSYRISVWFVQIVVVQGFFTWLNYLRTKTSDILHWPTTVTSVMFTKMFKIILRNQCVLWNIFRNWKTAVYAFKFQHQVVASQSFYFIWFSWNKTTYEETSLLPAYSRVIRCGFKDAPVLRWLRRGWLRSRSPSTVGRARTSDRAALIYWWVRFTAYQHSGIAYFQWLNFSTIEYFAITTIIIFNIIIRVVILGESYN